MEKELSEKEKRAVDEAAQARMVADFKKNGWDINEAIVREVWLAGFQSGVHVFYGATKN